MTDTETDEIERFNPPVAIVSDPPGYPAKRWPDIEEIRWGEPEDCDATLVPMYGGNIVTNREFLRVAHDELHRSLDADIDK